jgi:hypothetical protein
VNHLIHNVAAWGLHSWWNQLSLLLLLQSDVFKTLPLCLLQSISTSPKHLEYLQHFFSFNLLFTPLLLYIHAANSSGLPLEFALQKWLCQYNSFFNSCKINAFLYRILQCDLADHLVMPTSNMIATATNLLSARVLAV